MNATSTNITDTALITDAELADFLSDCTDSHPNTPEHEVTYQEDEQDVAPFDALDIPFALPVHNKMVAVNADGSAIDFSIGYGGAVGSDSAQKSAKQAATVGQWPSANVLKPEAVAAWAAVSRAIMNLYETTSRF